MEKQKNSRKKTLGRRFKLALALTPAILIMAVILVVPLASAQLNAPVPLQTSSVTGGNPSVNSMASTLFAVTPQTQQNSQPLQQSTEEGTSITGQLTVWSPVNITGQSVITGDLQITKTSGNPYLTMSPSLTMTGINSQQFTMDAYSDSFSQGEPLTPNGNITMVGSYTDPTVFEARGDITIGAITSGGSITEDCLEQNLNESYMYINTGPGGSGYIGDQGNDELGVKTDVRTGIKVYSGSLTLYTQQRRLGLPLDVYITLYSDHIHFHISTSLGSDSADYYYAENYTSLNLSQMAHDGILPTLTLSLLGIPIDIDMNDEILNMESENNYYSDLFSMYWGENTEFESWSVDPNNPQPSGTNPMIVTDGYIQMLNTRMLMKSYESAVIAFNSEAGGDGAGIRVVGSTDYPEGDPSVLRVHVEALSLTSGGWSGNGGYTQIRGVNSVAQSNVELVSDYQYLSSGLSLELNGSQAFPVETTVSVEGGMTLNGTLNIERNYGSSQIILTMDGYTSIESGISYISDDLINMTGDVTMTGDIGISGYSYMEGLITVDGYLDINSGLTEGSITQTIDGTLETDGEMTITDGEISIPGGSMVM
ncbi:MAG: hypothetical protein ACTSWF_13915, partial [Candidatus Freyarchaeota archaeon]